MTPEQARKKFTQSVEKDGKVLVAAKLQCSTTQVDYLVKGKRDPGLRVAIAIEEAYGIPAGDWVERPAARRIA